MSEPTKCDSILKKRIGRIRLVLSLHGGSTYYISEETVLDVIYCLDKLESKEPSDSSTHNCSEAYSEGMKEASRIIKRSFDTIYEDLRKGIKEMERGKEDSGE